MRHVIAGSIVLFAAGSWLAVSAQHTHAPLTTREKPVELLPGLGLHTHPVAGLPPQAQKYFDQGLNLLFGFNRYESLRAFHKATDMAPQSAMPLWGVAMALGPHINMDLDGDMKLNEGCAALEKAAGLARTAVERDYVAAARARCPEYDPAAYIASARKLHEAYPDDLDAATLYAESIMIPVRWKWFDRAGNPNGEMAAAIATLEAVLRRNPEHPGANHFYIHAVEMSKTPERAIPSSQRLMGIMPAAGHMVHMPGHIWLRTGDWETAAAVNERAAAVDRDYFAKTGVESGYMGYYLHNLQFVAYARAMQGRGADAIAAADKMIAEATPMIAAMPEMADAVYSYPLFARVRFARWDAVLRMTKPNEKMVASTALWHWGRAIAFQAKKMPAEARRQADLFNAAAAKVPAGWPWLNNKAADILAIAAESLRAEMAATPAQAAVYWRNAAERQDALIYDEPPPWYFPVRERLGAALLAAGEAGPAEAAFRQGMADSPRNGRMLAGLMKALERQGKTDAAAMVKREFEAAWKRADQPPPEL